MFKVFPGLLFIILLGLSCSNSAVDLEVEKKEILKLHDLQRGYHFNKDSVSLY